MVSAPTIDFDMVATETAALRAPQRADGMVRVQVVPLVRDSGLPGEETGATGALISQQLIVDYLASIAQRAVKTVRNGHVDQIDEDHAHPDEVSCLRCAVIGSTHMKTLAVALLEILASSNTDEEWNHSGVSDAQIISRLRRLAVSDADLEDLFGPYWAEVVLTGLRAEAADLEMMECVTRGENDVLWISEIIDDPLAARRILAAYHLGTVVCPRESRREDASIDLKRSRIARRFAVGMARVAGGETVPWLDRLPAPPL